MPRYGFNHLWMYVDSADQAQPADLRALDFQQRHGLSYARLPVNYWIWTKNFDYFHPDRAVWDKNTLREHYQPWIDLQRQSVRVHIGDVWLLQPGAFGIAGSLSEV